MTKQTAIASTVGVRKSSPLLLTGLLLSLLILWLCLMASITLGAADISLGLVSAVCNEALRI
ncbi:MAG: hypothetical protein F6K36_18940 [Symploca sp. SIO3C6]|uniref:Uncharacterized protein n=1 Tax=Symploca sp. SIO1C4 TaxID=2607765 RepID=A0A6B3NBZ0_9CYAN|nr:hypothetical protein [Symploca sp. SIO3C6]NER29063.1 hypothetical protein [Symploca sp. SIO1C4]